ncbi:hypothetical protein [Jonesia quinghaiensis]|uniref:hypothetical protein n=1 Tax=Jonesia quinghaiensis TaxID=262806 RepID=UPI0003F8DDEC|nr:hypothetical protein [Jonesia quinghaiensis]
MFTRSGRRASAFVAAVALTIGLSACSSDSADDAEQPTAAEESQAPAEATEGETVAEACATINDTMNQEADALQGAMANLESDDFDAATEAMGRLVTALKGAEEQVTNTEVQTAATEMRVVFEEFQGMMGDLNPENLDMTDEAEVKEYQEQAARFQEVALEVQIAGTAFDELCATA